MTQRDKTVWRSPAWISYSGSQHFFPLRPIRESERAEFGLIKRGVDPKPLGREVKHDAHKVRVARSRRLRVRHVTRKATNLDKLL
jgi:hypothetical protein